jgi:hypothetical protein
MTTHLLAGWIERVEQASSPVAGVSILKAEPPPAGCDGAVRP